MPFARGKRQQGGGPERFSPPLAVSGVVTAVQPQRRQGRVNVHIAGEYAFSLAEEVAATLSVGAVLDERAAVRLQERDRYHRALDHALTFLSYRPRSEREVRDRLARSGYPAGAIDDVLGRLRELGYVDDRAFAEYWVQQRQAHSPRGAVLLRQELIRKGADREAIGAALADAEGGDEAAVAAGAKKAHQLRALDEREFQQRLGAYLARRGFTWETITPAVRQLWAQRDGG